MKIRNGKYAQRKAISPIIATVLIIAVTLIAAVAIGGFVFGIFGSSSSTANVSVTAQSLVAADFATTTLVNPTCTAAGGVNTLTLSNTGTAAASATGVTITYGGSVNTFAISGTCIVSAAGLKGSTTNGNPQVIVFAAGNGLAVPAAVGQTYTGTISMSNGAVLIFTGSFS
jgi:flagellin-like protein